MNQTRLLRLSREDRKNYIREEARKLKITQLRHIVHEYGIIATDNMRKDELVDVVVDGLCSWAEESLNEVYVYPVLE